MASDGMKEARHLLAEIDEATKRAERQLSRVRTEGADHFQKNLDMLHGKLDEASLDRYTAHARALESVRAS